VKKFFITIDHTKVSATQTNFPYLFSDLASSIPAGFWTHVINANGSDIRFFDVTEITEFDREIVLFDRIGKKVEAWVRIPSVSSSVDTVICCKYGGATRSNDDSTWRTDAFVYHLQSNGSDSGPSHNTGSVNGGASAVAGKIEKGFSFDGSSGFVQMTNNIDVNGNVWLVEAWVNLTALPIGAPAIITSRSNWCIDLVRGFQPWAVWITPAGGIDIGWFSTLDCTTGSTARYSYSAGGLVLPGNWYHIVASGNKTTNVNKLWVNGVPISLNAYSASSTPWVEDSSQKTQIGAGFTGSSSPIVLQGPLNGIIDELRIFNAADSNINNTDYALTDFNNQNNPATFSRCGPQIGRNHGFVFLT
jgi:hypothetical protein